jgi:hypothetical protein
MGLLDYAAPGAKFPEIGTRVGGEVTQDAREMQQRDFDTGEPLYWDEEKERPRLQLVIEVQTDDRDPKLDDDDGLRTLYAKGDMLRAIRQACKRVKVKEIKPGGKLWVEFVAEEPPPRGKKGHPTKLYAAEYTPPAAAESPAVAADPRTTAGRDAHQKSLRSVGTAKVDDEPPF